MSAKTALLCFTFALAGCASSPSRRAIASAQPLYANGGAFQVRSELGRITLSAPECAPLTTAAAALQAWARKGDADESCVCAPGGACEIDVTGLVPDLVRANLGHTAFKPNCFNTALVGAGLAAKLEFTRFTDFKTALRAHCSPTAAPRPGDIGVVSLKGEEFSPIHAFIFLTPTFGFEKPGSDIQEPWRFMNPSAVVGGADYPRESSELSYHRCQLPAVANP